MNEREKQKNGGMTREQERRNERPEGGGVETEVSCLRRRLAEEERGRGKTSLGYVCVCALTGPSGGGVGACKCARGLCFEVVPVVVGVTPWYYLRKRQK